MLPVHTIITPMGFVIVVIAVTGVAVTEDEAILSPLSLSLLTVKQPITSSCPAVRMRQFFFLFSSGKTGNNTTWMRLANGLLREEGNLISDQGRWLHQIDLAVLYFVQLRYTEKHYLVLLVVYY